MNSLLSLVIPYYLSTMASLYPMRQLNRLLLPQLGRPINDTLNFWVDYLKVDQGFSFCDEDLLDCWKSLCNSCGECKISWEAFWWRENPYLTHEFSKVDCNGNINMSLDGFTFDNNENTLLNCFGQDNIWNLIMTCYYCFVKRSMFYDQVNCGVGVGV